MMSVFLQGLMSSHNVDRLVSLSSARSIEAQLSITSSLTVSEIKAFSISLIGE